MAYVHVTPANYSRMRAALSHGAALSHLVLLIMIAGFSSDARAEHTVEARRTRTAIRIDGELDPEEWKGAAKLDSFIQFEPYRGEPAQEKTEVYFLYDDHYIYFGFRSFDSQASRITAQLNQRDSDLFSDDSVFVVIDTFHDARSAYYFVTNPLGTQTDGRVGENGKVVEKNWDAAWKSAAARFAGGWTAEIAIPFAAIRFPAGSNKSWGFNVGRTCRRLLETSLWAGPLEERFEISQYGELRGLDLESAQRKYEVVPYLLGQGSTRSSFQGRYRSRPPLRGHARKHRQPDGQPRLCDNRGRSRGDQPHSFRD